MSSAAPVQSAPDFHSLNIGAAQLERDLQLQTVGTVFGIQIILCMSGMVWLGTQHCAEHRKLQVLLAVWTLAFIGIFLCLMRSFAQQSVAPVGWFPAATNWVVFGVWGIPLVMVTVYVLGFHRWYPAETSVSEAAR